MRHPELHSPGVKVHTLYPSRVSAARMLPAVRRHVRIAWIAVGPWGSDPADGNRSERATVTVVLSNGRCVRADAVVGIDRKVRERAMLGALSGQGGDDAIAATKRILMLRTMAVQKARGALERQYGNGVPEDATLGLELYVPESAP